ADLERKLVAGRRGGYCFEHNLLLTSALEHLGLEVEPMLARARVGGAPLQTRPATNLVLRVTDLDGRQWHADVGFGLGTLLDPIPFGPSGVHEQSGWSFRVVQDDELMLQALGPNGWAAVYSFSPRLPDRHRGEQLVGLHESGIAVRRQADRVGQPRRRAAGGAPRLFRLAARRGQFA